MTQHIVTAAAVKVSIGSPGGNRIAQFLRRSDVVPAGLDEVQLARLLERGLIAELPPIDPELELATTAVFDAAVHAEAARVIETDFMPVFDQRVQDAAAKLVADQGLAKVADTTDASQAPATDAAPPATEPVIPASSPAPAAKSRAAK